MAFQKVVPLLFFLTTYCHSANILYVIPFTSKSHYIMLKPIGLELARRGHNVTVITANRESNPPPNYREVMVDDKEIWDVMGDERPNIFTMASLSAEEFHKKILWNGGTAFTELTLNSTAIKAFLNEENTFDLVICEQFFQEALYALAHKYSAPLALVTTFGNCMRHNFVTGNPLQVATAISEFLDLEDPTSLWGRFRNLYFTIYEYVWWKYWYLGKHEALVKKYIPGLPQPVPSLYDIQRNASLMLINSHFSYDTPVAYLPNIVEIGGIHLTKSENSLPKDLKRLLDDSKEGVIYINFGSNIRSSELPIEKRDAFLKVFRKLKQTILWKWEDKALEGQLSNLVTKPWLPQKDILAHPHIKVFISHGGLIGTQEAIYHGVPIIGIPIYADQFNNLLLAQQIGFGKVMRYQDINETVLETILHDVLNNKSYTIKAKEMSKRFNDRLMNPLDTAMFWLEYVIRNKGADFIKNPARNMTWYEYTLLDVYILVAIVVLVSVFITNNLIRRIKNGNKFTQSIVKHKKLH
ncbi:UDP-glycosyltransferase UGT5-like [Zerene cesonia]|uniref:UDP-glycosyltransferase UGT5-like n=1 Tax=Zerene cesonia TaxID=33412 RepID=UPI0018E56FC6|nr:UDP-glycosyltransferase UGT5-like [Zerene cesonia]